MNISHNKYDAIENLIFNEGLRIESLEISPKLDKLFIHLNNKQIFIAPIAFYKGLSKGSSRQLKNFKLIGSGTGIHWPDLNEDLSLKGFLKEFLRQKVNSKMKLIISKKKF